MYAVAPLFPSFYIVKFYVYLGAKILIFDRLFRPENGKYSLFRIAFIQKDFLFVSGALSCLLDFKVCKEFFTRKFLKIQFGLLENAEFDADFESIDEVEKNS